MPHKIKKQQYLVLTVSPDTPIIQVLRAASITSPTILRIEGLPEITTRITFIQPLLEKHRTGGKTT